MHHFLTAKLELRPSRRKAAILERARAGAEDAFWAAMEGLQSAADGIVAEAASLDAREARKRVDAGLRELTRTAKARFDPRSLPRAVALGLNRDIDAAVGSYIGLKRAGNDAAWPSRKQPSEDLFLQGVRQLITSTTKTEEDAGRDDMARSKREPFPRGFTLASGTSPNTAGASIMLIRREANGPILALLNVIRPTDKAARTTFVDAGFDAATGEVLPKQQTTDPATKTTIYKPAPQIRSKSLVIVPVAFSKWHEHKFFSGNAALKSATVRREGDRWFLLAQFAVRVPNACNPEGVLGLDRGITNAVTAAAVTLSGEVRAAGIVADGTAKTIVERAIAKNRAHQRRKGRPAARYLNRVDHALHEIANEIVRIARERRLTIAVEKLDGLKTTITTKRVKFARKNPWQSRLKKAQLGKLERILTYKLVQAGLYRPVAVGTPYERGEALVRQVPAGGTSQTCAKCGHRDAANRPTQERFTCTACGHTENADVNAAKVIARRAVMEIKKGVVLDDLHRDMVEALKGVDDGGLGPVVPVDGAVGFVAARGTDVTPDDLSREAVT